ncbi:MAG: phosphotransferase [Planctomycetes bacterium]|nr:phosphotransferase [Planctomycetota bacterium]
MTPSTPAALPTDEALAAALRPLFALTTGADNAVVVGRRPNAYTSSSQSEVVTIRDPAGDHHNYLVKYDRGGLESAPSCRHGIAYCGRVYDALLATLPLRHLRTLGTIRVGPTGLTALVIEHLDDSLRVGEAPEVSGILAAAEWCGCFHHLAEPRRTEPALGFLVRYDRDYYLAWADRAERFAAGRSTTWLGRACAAFREMTGDLSAAPTTIIHGEMSPQNVLWRNGEIYPVDWESAAIGPGEIDIAALLFGWPEETVARCIEAYWEARRTPRPAAFPTRWAAATLYTALRWLPPPGTGDDPRFSLALDRLRETAKALGII